MKVLYLAVSVIFLLEVVRASQVQARGGPLPCNSFTPCGKGFFCSYPTGICGFDAGYGYCKQIEAVCPHIVQPVCGCDGRTYENYCYADKANVSINYEGKCNVAPTCLHNNDCVQTNGSQYCRYDVGQCGGKGVCVGVPTSCDTDWAPLCSCDGHSYLNPCMAGLNNQSVRYNSICDHQLSTVAGGEPVACMSDKDCTNDPRAFCMFPKGVCKPPGVCAVAALTCTDNYQPVCGCDGRIYSNDCMVNAAYQSEADPQLCGLPQGS